MTQISKKLLNSDAFHELFESFDWLIINLKNRDEVFECFKDLLTKHERVIIAKRIAILFLLSKGFTIEAISFHLKVSCATVIRLKRLMDDDTVGYNIIIKKLNAMQTSKRTNEKLKSIVSFFDALITAKTNMHSRAKLMHGA